jgi:hypothetical protein
VVYIYALVCPESNQVRYIGKSINPTKRLGAHVSSAVRFAYDHHTARWIRKLAASGLKPCVEVLQALEVGQDWRSAERMWIAKAKEQGWPITNTTAGGEGLDYIDPAEKAAYREKHRQAMRRYAKTPAGKQNIRRMLLAGQSPVAAERRRRSVKAACSTEQYRKKMSAINRSIASRPGMSERRSEQFKVLWNTQEYRDACMSGFSSPECKRKQSESKIKAWTDPEARNRMMKRWGSEERDAQRAAIESRREKMRPSPEGRERQRQAMRDLWAKRKAEGKRRLGD